MFQALMAKAIPWKLIGIGVAVIAIGILIWMHRLDDIAKDNKITELNGAITQLELDKVKLQTSNDSLQTELERRRAETQTIIDENNKLREVDVETQQELNKLRSELQSIERKARVEKIHNSRKASLLLRKANNQAECEWKHFDDFTGKCVSGKFVLNGERLVPLENDSTNNNEEQ